ncbi:MAG: helix-turn-helix domain containing protein [Oscillospiraceae bacterium]|nr:helix-turn-helix domain containing protein [Oscillospiraceae bacterium]
MGEMKENILCTALALFAQKGYEAVPVSEIAGALGVTKGALYKHYESKRAIFDSIVMRMEELDAQRAGQFSLPEGVLAEMEDSYRNVSLEQIAAFGRAQFRYWTQDEFPAAFRRLLTLEQYRSEEMQRLYQQYLGAGPLGYLTDLLGAMGLPDADKKAAAFYGPMFLFYSIFDGAKDKAAAENAFLVYLEEVVKSLGKGLKR